tara:strand:- start:179 stop:355 length:177 start_codon:yes stop_codon:yes gene_type:complete
MLNILKNLKKSTKIKIMVSLLSFSIATICLFNMFLLVAAFGYFFGGCLIGDILADETN